MTNTCQVVERKDKVLCILIILCAIFGNIINSGNFRIAGLVLNAYRIGMPLIAAYFLIKRWKKGEIWNYFSNRLYLIYGLVMVFWLLYGSVLLFVSRYAVFHEGVKELLDLFLGILLVYCITECCRTKAVLQYFMKVIKLFVCILCIAGLIEMIVGIHLAGSKYASSFEIENFFSVLVGGLASGKIFPFTTIFYGVNDFSAFLAIFFPLFFIKKEDTRAKKIRNVCMMLVITLIIAIEDANISLIAMLFAILLMVVLRGLNRYTVGSFAGVLLVGQVFANWIVTGIVSIKLWIGNLKPVRNYINGMDQDVISSIGEGMDKVANAKEVLTAQIQTAEQGYGSLYVRSMITLDALEMWVKSYFLGVGPGGFTNYLKKNGARTYIVNPHNWWLEILSQYGIFVFVAYVGMLFYLFLKNVRNYLKNKDFMLLQIACIIASYVIASIAPSSFLGYHYQWMVPAIALVSIKLFREESTDSNTQCWR